MAPKAYFMVSMSESKVQAPNECQKTTLEIRLQVEVRDQNMVKRPLGIYHRISTLYADPMMHSVELCISYSKFSRNA